MNRRNFFRFLPASAVGGAAVVLAKPGSPGRETLKHIDPPELPAYVSELMRHTIPSNTFRYKNWSIFWTGWKSASDNVRLCGQWVAAPNSPGRFHLYSAVPGWFGPFNRGEVFNGCHREDQDPRLYDFAAVPTMVHAAAKYKALNILGALCDLGDWPLAPWDERMSGERLAHLYLAHKGLVPPPRP